VSSIDLLLGFGGLLLTAFGYFFGRMFSQSEAVLAEKRRVYEQFLVKCPMAVSSYREFDPNQDALGNDVMQEEFGRLMLYASPDVTFAITRYIEKLQLADEHLGPDSPALHPMFTDAAKAQNDIVLEMRRDALGWSMFGHRGKTRLPTDRMEQAKRKLL